MNRDAIRNTARCRFDDREKVFIVESALFRMVKGIAETEVEAWSIFNDLVQETYINYLEGKLSGYDKRGRPAKGRVGHHAELQPETKKIIVALSKHFCCSQGEVIDYLVWYHDLAVMPSKPGVQKVNNKTSWVAESAAKYASKVRKPHSRTTRSR